jgi:Cu(I)/Ag(I) efflux system membrane protein CusA/SilA
MLARTIRFVLRYPFPVLLLIAVMVLAGLAVMPFGSAALRWLPRHPLAVDAIPHTGDNQQIVSVDWHGRSPQDVENQVTFPLTSALLGVPGVETVRSTSMFGFAAVHLVFAQGADPYWCRSRILEKLSALPTDLLPAGVQPQLGPDATALGQVFWYTLEGRDSLGRPTGGWELHELRRVQDFYVKYHLLAAGGVAEVASAGGLVQEYQVDVDPARLKATGATLDDVVRAVQGANLDVGANTIEINRVEYFVRSLGYVRQTADWEQIVLRPGANGTPLLLRDVARISAGPADRRGVLDQNGAEAVGGVVVARFDANAAEVTANIRARIAELSPGLPSKILPDGRRSQLALVPFYDRGELIAETLGTLRETLWLEMLITLIVVVFLVRSWRASALIASVLPLGVLLTFIAMKLCGVPANLVSLAGVAIAIGVMVDMAIIFVENCWKHFEREQLRRDADPAAPPRRRAELIYQAGREVLPAIATSMAVTLVSFLPVFALPGVEGRLFRPLAFTKTAALGGAFLLTLVLLPILVLFLAGRPRLRQPVLPRLTPRQVDYLLLGAALLALTYLWRPLSYSHGFLLNFLFIALVAGGLLFGFRQFIARYSRVLRWSLAHKRAFFAIPVVIVAAGLLAGARLGREFMPALDEGQFMLMPTYVAQAGIEESREILQLLDRAVAQIPEVERVVGKAGRAETALDPAPLSMFEILIRYKPEFVEDSTGAHRRQWRSHIRTSDDIWTEVRRVVSQVPGLAVPPKLHPIEARTVMLQTGVRAPLALRLSGPDQAALETFAGSIEAVLRQTPGVRPEAVFTERALGKPYLELEPDRAALARYGLSVMEFQNFLEAALGGMTATTTVEGRERYRVRVRFARDFRDRPEAISALEVPTPVGARVPLHTLARVQFRPGPVEIRSENGQLVQYVVFDKTAGTDAGRAFDAVRRALDAARADGSLTVPAGVSYDFSGTYRQQVEAFRTLRLVVAAALLLIFGLLYAQFRSGVVSLLVFAGVAVALAGGFLLLWLYGQPWFLNFTLFGEELRPLLGLRPVHLSVAVWIGFLALFGIAANDGVLMATYLQQLNRERSVKSRSELTNLVLEAGQKRIRPALMTTATALLALLPVLTSHGRGSDLMAPMAIPIFGGMLIQVITVLLVPVAWAAWKERQLPASKINTRTTVEI